MFPENQNWARTLVEELNYHSLDIYDEPGIIFVGKRINSHFLPGLFNENLDNIGEDVSNWTRFQ